jgi:hypothetical protein
MSRQCLRRLPPSRPAAPVDNIDLRRAQANLGRGAALLREARATRQPTAEVNFDPSSGAPGAAHECAVPLGRLHR